MTSLDSNVINIAGCQQGGNGAISYAGGFVRYAFADGSDNLNIATADLREFVNSATRSTINWTAMSVKQMFANAAGQLKFQTASAPALIAIGDYTYLFWSDTSGPLAVMRSRVDGTQSAVATIGAAPEPPQPGTKVPFKGVKSDLSACITPDGKAIALQFVAGAPKGYTHNDKTLNKGATLFVTCLLTPGDFQPTDVWKGVYAAMPLDNNGSIVDNFSAVSAAWFTQGQSRKSTGNSTQPTLIYYQLVACYGNHQAKSFAWTVNERCLPFYLPSGQKKGETKPPAWIKQKPIPVTGIGDDSGDAARGVFLTRDPAGAILALYGYNGGSSFSTGQVMAAWLQPNSVNKGTPGLNQPQWVQFRAMRPANGQAFAVGERPCAAFVPLPSTQGTSPCKLPPPGTNKPPQYFKNCTLQKQVMMVASASATSSSQSQAQALTRFYGTSVAIPEYSTATPSNAQQIALSLIGDAFPYPIPDASVWDNSSPDGTTDWQACAYQYLVGNQSETEVQIEGGVAFGIKGGTTVDTGVGIVSEASAAVGARAVLDSMRSKYNATSFIVSSKGVPSTAGSPGNNQVFDMSPNAALFGRGYPTLSQDVSVFVARNNSPVYGASVPLVGMLRISGSQSPVAVGGQYNTYCYTPGNLLSYQPSAINAQMKTLFNNLSNTQQKRFVIGGANFASFYTGGNYLGAIDKAFGAKCFGEAGNLSYLEFSISQTGMQESEFQDTSQFTAAGGYYVNASAYVGVGTSGGLDVFGVGEKVGGYAMVGAELNFSLMGGGGTTSTWGLSLNTYLNPLATGESYTVRMYFLKPSRLWAAEIENFGVSTSNPPAIDFVDSAPVRILFTVPYISSNLATRLKTAFGS